MALHAVAQQSGDAAFEVDAFDPVELALRAVVKGEYPVRYCNCIGDGDITIPLPA